MENPNVYQLIKSGKSALSEQVAHQILDLISSKQLEVGKRLPSIEELSSYLGVSRTSIREAIKLLDAWGVVTVRHGVGTFVTGMNPDALTIPLKVSAEREEEAIWKLHQLREALEPYIAAKAAENATHDHIKTMQDALRRMEESLDKPEEFIEADLDFHTALAEATGNEIFLVIIHPVIDLLQDARRIAISTAGSGRRAQSYHRLIFEHIKAGKPEEAEKAMKSHLDQTWGEIQPNIEKKTMRAR
jgi:GntR family transcriptional repressor for pyruvate dehydrogenase complex